MTTDLDKGGPYKRASRVYLGPSLGWIETPGNISAVIATGTTTIDLSATLITVNVNGSVTIQLPSSKAKTVLPGELIGAPITVVDIGGYAAANNITILPFGSETIMSLTSITISSAYGAFTLIPNTVSGGWNNQ